MENLKTRRRRWEMRPIILERADIHFLKNFIEKTARWCDCGMCELCLRRKTCEKRLEKVIPSEEEAPHRLTFEGEDLQCLVDLVDAAAERHFCGTPYLEAFCELCNARGMFERRLLVHSY
ncbi:hypothetical protein GW869_01640 [bacterium]|nr:hypothetical protein [bacterium]